MFSKSLQLQPKQFKIQSNNVKIMFKKGRSKDKLNIIFKSNDNQTKEKNQKCINNEPSSIRNQLKQIKDYQMMKADDHFIAKPEEGKEGHFQSSANDYIQPLIFNARCFLSAPEPTVDERTLQDQYIHIRQNLETKSREFQHLYENYQNLKKKMPVNISNKNVCNDFCSATKDTTPQSFGASTNRSTHQTNDSILRFNIQEKSDSTAESVVKTMFDESSDERITFDKVIMELQARMTEDMAIIADPSDYQLNVMELFTNLRTIDETGESQTSLVSMALREMRSLQNRGCDDTISQCTIRDR
jgi:hypothetical protein